MFLDGLPHTPLPTELKGIYTHTHTPVTHRRSKFSSRSPFRASTVVLPYPLPASRYHAIITLANLLKEHIRLGETTYVSWTNVIRRYLVAFTSIVATNSDCNRSSVVFHVKIVSRKAVNRNIQTPTSRDENTGLKRSVQHACERRRRGYSTFNPAELSVHVKRVFSARRL